MKGKPTGAQEEALQPLLPSAPFAEHDPVPTKAEWHLVGPAPSRSVMPRQDGSPVACGRRHRLWQYQGVWEHIRREYRARLDAQGQLG